jgi:hypothetical protein
MSKTPMEKEDFPPSGQTSSEEEIEQPQAVEQSKIRTSNPWYEKVFGKSVLRVITGIVAGLTVAIIMLYLAPHMQHRAPSASRQTVDEKPGDRGHISLSEDELRKAIMMALQRGEVREAIKYLSYMQEGEAKREECERLFSFCTKNEKPKEEALLSEQCGIVKK